MQCPLCLDAPLEPKFVGATEVDVCRRCRGIWLDRGELDRLLDDGPADRRDRDDRRDRRDGDDRWDRDDRDDRWDHDDRDDRWDRDDRRDPRSKRKKSRVKKFADLLDDVLDL